MIGLWDQRVSEIQSENYVGINLCCKMNIEQTEICSLSPTLLCN